MRNCKRQDTRSDAESSSNMARAVNVNCYETINTGSSCPKNDSARALWPSALVVWAVNVVLSYMAES